MKKLINYLLVITLVLVQVFPFTVNAAKGTNTNDGTIKIENIPTDVETTYNVYQVLQLESYDTDKKAYTYTVKNTDATVEWYEFLNSTEGKKYVTLTASKEDNVYVVTGLTQDNAVAFTEAALQYAEDNNLAPMKSYTTNGEETTYTFTGLNLGYYLVDSSLGSLIILNSTVKDAVVTEKNGVPEVTKEVEEDSNPGNYNENYTNTADIGQTVNYKTKITAQEGAEKYVLYDKMDAGLTFSGSVEIVLDYNDDTKDNKTLVDPTDYDLVVGTANDNYTFKIVFTETLEDSLKDGDKIIVSYSAVVNEKAVVGGKGNVNDTYLEYGDNNETTHKTTTTYTFKFDLFKTDGTNELNGAEFILYKKVNDKEVVMEFVEVKDGDGNITSYRVATANDTEKTTTIKVGSTTISGLDEDTYYLRETKAPEGYNKLTSDITVAIDANISASDGSSSITINSKNTDDVTVVNTTGALLPTTGGMGTTLFITVGSMMVLGFGLLLVTKLRMSKMSI